MRAVVIPGFHAEPELVELPDPAPRSDEVLVRIHAAGMNPFDWKVADGALEGAVEHAFPLVMGSDGAGVVEAVGSDVDRFRPGDRVYGQFLNVARGLGSYAELAIAADGKLALVPASLSFTVAAALPTASVTAYQLVEEARVGADRVVLVNGGSGGVGQSTVQFAAWAGAHVIATASSDLAAHLRELGAAEVIDFTHGSTADQVLAAHPDGIHAVIDLVSNPGEADAFVDLLRPGGVIISTNGAVDVDALADQEQRGVNLYSNATPGVLAEIAELAATGRLRVAIDAEVPLDEAPAAVARARNGRARGKTVFVTAASASEPSPQSSGGTRPRSRRRPGRRR